MRLGDLDAMATIESEAYMSAQIKLDNPITQGLNSVVHRKIQQLIADTPTIDAVPVVRKPVPGYEGYYEVDNLGRVFSVDRIIRVNDNGRIYDKPVHGVLLKQTNHSQGYKTVALTKNGKTKQEYVHRIVASTFIPNPDNLPVVNHKDEDKTNNFVDNLEWCTVSYNNTYGEKTKKQAEKIRGIPHKDDHKEKISNSLKEYYKTHVSASTGRKSEKRKPYGMSTERRGQNEADCSCNRCFLRHGQGICNAAEHLLSGSE